MPFPSLQKYLSHLHDTGGNRQPNHQHYWLDQHGQACGRYYHATLTSAFQAIRTSRGLQAIGYDGYARSYASNRNEGLNVWRLLEHAANDAESIELDRLCRILHAINFYRQPEATGHELFLTIHPRLLAGVASNHGMAFRRVLDLLEIPQQNVVLQLPQISGNQQWILNYVVDNYRRNGFRLGIHAGSAEEALQLLDQVPLNAIKLLPEVRDAASHQRLLEKADQSGARLIYKRVQTPQQLTTLQDLHAAAGSDFFVQGFLFDKPQAELKQSEALLLGYQPAMQRHAA
jgi:EAL domain-containing protein (putative c-di-GMP-specific phosphodiesterase class I)